MPGIRGRELMETAQAVALGSGRLGAREHRALTREWTGQTPHGVSIEDAALKLGIRQHDH